MDRFAWGQSEGGKPRNGLYFAREPPGGLDRTQTCSLFCFVCFVCLSSSGGSRVGRRGAFCPLSSTRQEVILHVMLAWGTPKRCSWASHPARAIQAPGSPGGSPAGLKALRGHFWRPPRRLSCMVCSPGAHQKSAPGTTQPARATHPGQDWSGDPPTAAGLDRSGDSCSGPWVGRDPPRRVGRSRTSSQGRDPTPPPHSYPQMRGLT